MVYVILFLQNIIIVGVGLFLVFKKQERTNKKMKKNIEGLNFSRSEISRLSNLHGHLVTQMHSIEQQQNGQLQLIKDKEKSLKSLLTTITDDNWKQLNDHIDRLQKDRKKR